MVVDKEPVLELQIDSSAPALYGWNIQWYVEGDARLVPQHLKKINRYIYMHYFVLALMREPRKKQLCCLYDGLWIAFVVRMYVRPSIIELLSCKHLSSKNSRHAYST